MPGKFEQALMTWREAETEARRLDWALALAVGGRDEVATMTLTSQLQQQRVFTDEMLKTVVAMLADVGEPHALVTAWKFDGSAPREP